MGKTTSNRLLAKSPSKSPVESLPPLEAPPSDPGSVRDQSEGRAGQAKKVGWGSTKTRKKQPRPSFGTEKCVQLKFWYAKIANEHKTKITKQSSTFFSRLMFFHLFRGLLLWNCFGVESTA